MRILQAASTLVRENIATISLIGNHHEIQSLAHSHRIDLKDIRIVDDSDTELHAQCADVIHEARRHKPLSREEARQLTQNRLMLGVAMVRCGMVNGLVAGAVHATAEVVRSALQVIGMRPDSRVVSSFFLMEHTLPHQASQGTALYADCAMIIDPNPEQLASIAMDTADNARSLAHIEPKVALLSFSTAGSAAHPLVDKVRSAGRIIAMQRPDIDLMTEVQFDAAVMPEILQRKAPDIKISAPANVFIFPDLQSANIGYKIAQRIGGVEATGPILQGLRLPVNDLSRGCSIRDIIRLVAVTAVQSQPAPEGSTP